MAYTPITLPTVGDPITKDLFDDLINNGADHENRINTIEITTQRTTVFKLDIRNASSFPSATGLLYYEADSDFVLSDCTIQIFEKGSLAGFLEIDIKKSTTDLNGTSFSSVFTTKPKITYSTATDYQKSTNQVFDAGAISVSTGDYLRFDITQAPTGGVCSKFLLTLFGA